MGPFSEIPHVQAIFLQTPQSTVRLCKGFSNQENRNPPFIAGAQESVSQSPTLGENASFRARTFIIRPAINNSGFRAVPLGIFNM